FGRDKVAVMHSKLTPGERYDQWEKIRKGDCDIVIGARSAVFAPVENIGLIVLDEEHESSYKSDQTPKYDTVEIAAKRTTHYNGIVLMGSATPSITILKRCEDGIYEKLYLSERYNKVQLPEVHIADMREELKRGNKSVFSRRLYDEIENCLKNREQVILFINKRGHSSFVSCRSCGYVVKCEKCQLPMTYHKDSENMVCHYCGRRHDVPKVCPECKSPYIKFFGAGTERVLEEIQSLMPDAKAAKIDFDESKVKGAIEETLDSFGKEEIDILVGTQLVGKGLDFKNVGLVGIVAIDMALNLPDYRSSERVFQMITQAAGRAGRGDKRGRVIVQTYEPENFAVTAGAEQDIEKFYKREIFVRKMMDYPPFGNFTRVSVMAHNMEDEKKASELWLSYIEKNLGKKSVINIKRENKHTKKNGFRTTMLLKYSADKRKVFSAMAKEIKEKLKASRAEVSSIIDINPNNTWRN
ncbi:MAG: primosomal protein N', partial [Eubacterium sp.]|nr:primosomal protein N' [Eubacterium sp.]